ncbi:ABC transporter ATP-binding protein [Anaerobacillus isosaccharinicus]|uniref:Carnitine transport ATP-binding protein OpuCA n=1 Tax=Anaerobacillus isosaccharinicus TaxID=1532552 RepID=A0A1S2M636_9BACI|nr:ABC transporter ATP-binding protein [Anaerobacillus isosaccharinicus]MBA5588233.1 ABC transporter ATP-binding protein [Anaerobacillus isosaccharinicus]QOY38321.1 ABC transporter ATP-binding protein [Anaerobacillus isosaccharinicus]
MNNSIIDCQQLSKSFNEKIVINNVNFALNEGEILCIVGPSGCGKTTLLRCIAGLEPVTSGKIFIEDHEMNHLSAQARPVVMMFQQPLLFPHLSVLDNTSYGLKMQKMTKSLRIEKAMAMLKSMEIEDLANVFPHEISGGQQQRVALARALMVQPKLLLLDEPFSSLDPELRSSLRGWVKKKLKEWNTTAIFVTHDKEEAMVLADSIAVMKEGSILQMGTPDELYENPTSLYVANYISEGFSLDETFIPLSKIKVYKNEHGTKDHSDRYFTAKILAIFFKGGQRFIQIELLEICTEITIACHLDVSKNDTVCIGVSIDDMLSFTKGD